MDSKSQQQRGLLIVFEGIDHSGKTSQSNLLVNRLNDQYIPVIYFRFPNRTTPIGQMIDAYLKQTTTIDDHVIHLLFSANRWELAKEITEHIQKGTTVVVDRYAYSGVAYSAAKGIDLDWCKSPDRGLPTPDLLFYLDVSVEEASKRGNFGQERYEKKEFQQKVHAAYNTLLNVNFGPTKVYVLDAAVDKTFLEMQIQTNVKMALQEKGIRENPLMHSLFMF